jgi:uncharacterized membrane protein
LWPCSQQTSPALRPDPLLMSQEAAPIPSLSSSERVLWLDWFRGLAVLGMVWVHTANALLHSDLQSTPWFAELTFWHGLIAPSFFWISGFVRGFLAHPDRPPGLKSATKLLRLLLIGYALHFPFHALFARDWSISIWRSAWQVDVLHTLAFTGLILILIERLLKPSPSHWHSFLWLTPMLAFVLPTDAANHWHIGLPPIDAWINPQNGSLFPIFPWVGFGIAGFASGRFCRGANQKKRITQLAAIGALFALALPQIHGLNSTHVFFLQRLGWILLFAGATVWILAPLFQRLPLLDRWLRSVGRQTLWIYVIHLLVLFSIPFPGGALNQQFHQNQPLLQTFLWFLAITLICLTTLTFKSRPKHLS